MKENSSEKSSGVRRRSVLKGLSTAGFAGSVPSITSGEELSQEDTDNFDYETKQELEEIVQEYNSVGKVRVAFAKIGTPLLQTLKREGFIKNHAIKSLPITEIISPKQHTLGEEDGVMVVGVTTPRGLTARIQVVKKNDEYTNVITIDTHTEVAHALVRNRGDSSGNSQIVYPDGIREVSAMCTAGSYCKRTLDPDLSVPCYSMEVKCCFSEPSCTDIGELGSECLEGECYDSCLQACGIM